MVNWDLIIGFIGIFLSILALGWHYITWKRQQIPFPVLAIEHVRLKHGLRDLHTFEMIVYNKGRGTLKLSKAAYAITKGVDSEDEHGMDFPILPTHILLTVDAIPHENVITFKHIPQLTDDGLFAGPEGGLSLVLTRYFDKPGVYNIVLVIEVKSTLTHYRVGHTFIVE